MNSVQSLVLLVLALTWGVQAGSVLQFQTFTSSDCSGTASPIVLRFNPNGKCYPFVVVGGVTSGSYKASCGGITVYAGADCTGQSQGTGTGCTGTAGGSARYSCATGDFFTVTTAAGTCTNGALPSAGVESVVGAVGGCMSPATGLGVKVDSISGTSASVTFSNDAFCAVATGNQTVTLGTCFQNPVNQQATIVAATVGGAAASVSAAVATLFTVFAALSFVTF